MAKPLTLDCGNILGRIKSTYTTTNEGDRYVELARDQHVSEDGMTEDGDITIF